MNQGAKISEGILILVPSSQNDWKFLYALHTKTYLSVCLFEHGMKVERV